MYFNWKRYIASLLILIGCDIAVGYLFGALGIGGIYYVLGISLVMSFVIALINYPSPFKRHFLKDPSFHKHFAILFLILFLLNYFL